MKKKLTYHNFYFYLLLLSPILVVYILFFALPVVSSMFFSLTNFNGISLDFKWMGLKNYDVAFHDRVFRKAMVNTFLFALGATVLQNFFAILFALALNSKLKLQGFMRMLVFAPCMLSPIVVAFIWQFIYMPDGILNNLQSISSDILEAADIDGASRWQKFKRIILPMLAPATTINITLAFTQSLKVFDIVYAMTNGGPLNSTETVGTYVVVNMNRGLHGYASALTVLLTVVIVVFGQGLIGILKKREEAVYG